ncbi:MAG: hypothetical protein V3W14_01160, partial [Candidatus Neomarinimicrobiota bacterium]
QQLNLVLFYDGQERIGKSLPSTLEIFRESWKRHGWYVLTQKKSDYHEQAEPEIAPANTAGEHSP